jgi:hypothetical protein
MENFWSLLKCGINGTFVSVEPMSSFSIQCRQEMNDADRFSAVVSQLAASASPGTN